MKGVDHYLDAGIWRCIWGVSRWIVADVVDSHAFLGDIAGVMTLAKKKNTSPHHLQSLAPRKSTSAVASSGSTGLNESCETLNFIEFLAANGCHHFLILGEQLHHGYRMMYIYIYTRIYLDIYGYIWIYIYIYNIYGYISIWIYIYIYIYIYIHIHIYYIILYFIIFVLYYIIWHGIYGHHGIHETFTSSKNHRNRRLVDLRVGGQGGDF